MSVDAFRSAVDAPRWSPSPPRYDVPAQWSSESQRQPERRSSSYRWITTSLGAVVIGTLVFYVTKAVISYRKNNGGLLSIPASTKTTASATVSPSAAVPPEVKYLVRILAGGQALTPKADVSAATEDDIGSYWCVLTIPGKDNRLYYVFRSLSTNQWLRKTDGKSAPVLGSLTAAAEADGEDSLAEDMYWQMTANGLYFQNLVDAGQHIRVGGDDRVSLSYVKLNQLPLNKKKIRLFHIPTQQYAPQICTIEYAAGDMTNPSPELFVRTIRLKDPDNRFLTVVSDAKTGIATVESKADGGSAAESQWIMRYNVVQSFMTFQSGDQRYLSLTASSPSGTAAAAAAAAGPPSSTIQWASSSSYDHWIPLFVD